MKSRKQFVPGAVLAALVCSVLLALPSSQAMAVTFGYEVPKFAGSGAFWFGPGGMYNVALLKSKFDCRPSVA